MQRPTIIFMGVRRVPLEVNAAVAAAKAEGFDIALVAPAQPVNCGTTFSDVEIVDIYDRPKALEAAVRLAHRTNARGVVSWTDIGVELASALAARCGLPGPLPDAARRARSKYLMREALRSQPDIIPKFRRVRSLEDLAAAFDEIGTPAVLKPVGGSGSRSIFQVTPETDLPSLFAQAVELTGPGVARLFADYPGEFVYEERLGGTEHSVEGIVHNGTALVIGITDKWVTYPYYVEYEQVHPTALDAETQLKLHEMTRRVVGAIGIDACAFHLECRVDSAGNPKLLEIAARPGGGYIASHLVPLSSGIPFHRNLIRVATGSEPDMRPSQKMFAGSRGILSDQAGRFEGFDGVESIIDQWGLEHFALERDIGGKVVLPPGDALSAMLGYVVARATSYEDVRSIMDRAVTMCRPRIVSN